MHTTLDEAKVACLESPTLSQFASASRAEGDSLNLFLVEADLAEISLEPNTMPWFRRPKSHRTKRKLKISKEDISEPADFRHCYHAVLDPSSEGFSGLPPQWPSVVPGPASGEDLKTPSNSSLVNNGGASEKTRHKGEKKLHSPHLKREKASDSKSLTPTSEDSGAPLSENNAKNIRSSNSIASSNSALSLTKRPSPLVRGSDTSLEDTIKLIRKQCQSRSNENVQEEELQAMNPQAHGQPEKETHVVSRGRFYSQPRAGSFMQLRSSPINRKHVVSYTSSSTSAMAQGTDQLPSSAFCLSAPSEVIQSDLGLYHLNRETSSGLSHYHINSPSESSGYFGSNGSSLCNSRMSSAQHISNSQPSSTQAQFYGAGHAHARPSDVQDIEEDAELSPAGIPHSTSYQHRFYSLQRHHDSSGSAMGQYAHSHHRHAAAGPPGGVPLRGVVMSHYGTAPRAHRTIHSTQSSGTPSSEVDSFQRIHECSEGDLQGRHHEPASLKSSNTSASAYTPTGSGSVNTHRKEGRSSRMNFEHFRMTLELLVNPADPRMEYADFVKIGEGSTGNVYTARHIATNRIVAVKKMNLRKQQRRELLFNEVSGGVMYDYLGTKRVSRIIRVSQTLIKGLSPKSRWSLARLGSNPDNFIPKKKNQ